MKSKPRVLNTHGSLLGYKKYLRRGFQQLPYKVYDCLTFKLAARSADAIIVSSKFEYADAVEFGIDQKKLHVIPMGIDLPEGSRNYAKDSPLNILFVGRLARVRRVELLIMAAAKLTIPYHVTIVGGEEETSSVAKSGYLDELKKLCEDLEIAEHVTFAGAKLPEEVKAYYQNADVFVYPSLYENFGQPILEAAAAGLPVISTEVGVAKEIVRDGETGFLVSGQPGVLAEKINLLSDSKVRLEFGETLQQVVKKEFGWDRVMQKYLDVYRSL